MIQLLIDYTHIYIWKEIFPESIFQIITTSEFGYLEGIFINLFIIHSEYLNPDFSIVSIYIYSVIITFFSLFQIIILIEETENISAEPIFFIFEI